MEDMIDAASLSEVDEEGKPKECVFDKHAFARALTMDVQKYDVNNESSISTHYFDVFHPDYSTEMNCSMPKVSKMTLAEEDIQLIGSDQGTKGVNYSSLPKRDKKILLLTTLKRRSGSLHGHLLITADSYRSKLFYIFLWLCAVFTYLSYMTKVHTENFSIENCSDFICRVENGAIMWTVVMIQLCVFGTLFITCSSAGQSIYSSSKLAVLFGMASVAFCTILPQHYEVETSLFNTKKDLLGGSAKKASLITGCILISLHFVHLVRLTIPKRLLTKFKVLERLFTPVLARSEYQTKQAAAYKVNLLIKNAYDVHTYDDNNHVIASTSSIDSAYGKALLNFSKMRNTTLKTGGVLWAWKQILTGKIFTKEGVWLHSRIIAGNVAQLLVCIYFKQFGLSYLSRSYDTDSSSIFDVSERKLEDQMPGSTDNTHMGNNFTIGNVEMGDNQISDNDIWEYIPQAWVFIVCDMIAGPCAFLACLSITIRYIPSTISTVLKLRSGLIQSLQDKKSLRRRKRGEKVTVLYGSFFWGIFFTAMTIYGVTFLIIFLICWTVTRVYVVTLLASLCGLFITVVFKTLVLTCLRGNFYEAFYRKKPAQANFMIIVLECWSLGLTTGFMFARATKLIFASFLYLGRVDIPFISSEAGEVFGMELDAYPTAFLKDLLSHEAHRHPYIERLGAMYLMKLRHGESFARSSGSCWRLLFVFALMPWMRKYRVIQQHENDESGFKFGNFRMSYKPELRFSQAKERQQENNNTECSIKMTQQNYGLKDINEENGALER